MAFTDEVVEGVRVPRWVPDEAGTPSNFGDEIGPMLVRRLAGTGSTFGKRLLSVGSVVHFAEPGDVVWGAGVNGKVRQRVKYPLDVRAVRGPLTRTALLGNGVPVPEVYGDPALLVPRLFDTLTPVGDGGMLVVPNLNELDRVTGDEVLSPLGDPFEIAARIAGAGFVVASSLHALVLADAFGIPARPLVPAAEHPLKYLDYYAGTGRPRIVFAETVREAIDMGPVDPPDVDLDAIEQSFPSDLWHGQARTVDDTSADYARLRDESARTMGRLVRAVGNDESAASALQGAHQIAAGMPEPIVELLSLCSEAGNATDIAAAAHAYLVAHDAKADVDRRVARALRRVSRVQGASDIVVSVAVTGKVSLARAIARGEAPPEAGAAHVRAVAEPERNRAGFIERLLGRSRR